VAAWLDDDRRKMRDSRFDSYFRHIPIDKTDLQKRCLRILSALFKALEERGYKLSADSYGGTVQSFGRNSGTLPEQR